MLHLPKTAKGPIFLPVETTVRELDAKLLVAAEAVAKGYAVIVGAKSETLNIAERVGCGIWLDKGHGDHYIDARLSRLRRSNVCCTALDEEGFLYASDEAYFTNSGIKTGAALKYLDSIFVWGTHQKKTLETFSFAREKLTLTGNPRFDLYHARFRSMFSEKIRYLENKYQTYILINTNFAPGNYAYFYKKPFLENLQDSGAIKNGEDYEFFKGWSEYAKVLFERYSEMVVMLAKELPHVNLIIRPHPSEEHTTWIDSVKGCSNICVNRDGNVIDWIFGAKAVIHTGCTTGVEAFVGGVPVLRYHPVYDSRYESALSNSLGDSAGDHESLLAKAKKIVAGDFNNANHHSSELEHYLCNFNEANLAYENIVNEFDRLSGSGSTQGLISHNLFNSLSASFVCNAKTKIRFIRNVLKSIDFRETDRVRKFDDLKVDDVSKKVGLIMAILEDKKGDEVSRKYVSKQLGEKAIGIFPV